MSYWARLTAHIYWLVPVEQRTMFTDEAAVEMNPSKGHRRQGQSLSLESSVLRG